MDGENMTQTRASTRTRIPQGLREASSATTNSRSGIMPPGSIASKAMSMSRMEDTEPMLRQELTTPEATRPKTANPETKRPGSVTRQPTTKAHTRGNSYASSTTSRSTTPASRAANGPFSSTVGPGSRPPLPCPDPKHPSTGANLSAHRFRAQRAHWIPIWKTPPQVYWANERNPFQNPFRFFNALTPKPPPRPFLSKGSSTKSFDHVTGPEWDQDSRERNMEELMQTFMTHMNQQGQASSGLKETVEVYKTRINELETSRDSLKEINVTQRVELESLRNQLQTAEHVLKEAKRDQEIAMDDLDRRQRIEMESIQQDNKKEMEAINSRHQEEVRELKRQFDREIEDEKAARVRALGQLTSQSALDTQKSQIELERKDRELNTLNIELQELKEDLARERKSVQDLKQNLDIASSNSVTLESSIRALKAHIEFLEGGREEQSKAFERSNQQMMDALAETDAIREKLRREETLRRKLHNQVQELKGNIRVFCRVRPSLKSEPASQLTLMQYPDEADDAKEINILGPEEKTSLGMVSRKNNTFSFDRVFNPTTQNAEVFDEISQLVQSALDGYNVCIFCYGQTGSGKTHTMSSADGMIPRAVHQIYETAQGLEEKGWRYSMAGNFVEVYNENLNDLLGNPDELDKKKHEIRHDMQRGKTTITDITTVNLDSPEMVESILKNADANRSVAATKANERSSRSHSVFILKLTGVNHITGERSEGTLNLVDLAGSERLSHSGATGERLKETQNINRSLSSLGDVISALGQGKEGGHIPYRNSKLTYLLQFSLGGNSKTLMFVMVSPLQAHMSETLTSLKFATKVHNTHIGTAKRQARVRDA
ncbi:hypothetical protein N7499_004014 [Penicillium canescens]|nr:hypothetical protein N7522_011806 [Penicillium canescens]KAJ6089167.1 hypothetical protein N7499_004014 [Penicillium canescens]